MAKKIRFWHDVWIGGCPLKIAFTNIYLICNQQTWTVHRSLEGGLVNLSFRRNFEDREDKEWLELSQLLEGISLTIDKDSVKWVLENSRMFSTSSMYRELTFSGYANRWLMLVWSSKLPLKIRIFLWKVLNNKIQSASQLKKRNWSGPVECKLRGLQESTDHLFFSCVVSQFSWCIFRDALSWDSIPLCFDDLPNLCRGMSNKQTQYHIFLFGCCL
jgi:hypothetical protein